MLKYRGLLGNVRRALEDFAAMLTGSGLTVGSRGWEARLELGKLPAILASRMDELAGLRLHPAAEARVLADISGLEAQFGFNQAVMQNPALRGETGRGFVAAEEATPPDPRLVAEIRALAVEAGTRGDEFMERLQARLAELSPTERAGVVQALSAPVPRALAPSARPDPNIVRLEAAQQKLIRDLAFLQQTIAQNPRAAQQPLRLMAELTRLRIAAREGFAGGDLAPVQALRQGSGSTVA